jgi:hypothetical protein
MSTSAKSELAKAKKLNRAMASYAQATAKHLGVSFSEGVRQMKLQAHQVAADLSVSQAFVELWTTKELDICTRRDVEDRTVRANPPKRHSLSFAGYDFLSGPDGTQIDRKTIDVKRVGDYGADPLGDGTFRMVPSGDIVDLEERNQRLARRR